MRDDFFDRTLRDFTIAVQNEVVQACAHSALLHGATPEVMRAILKFKVVANAAVAPPQHEEITS